MGKLVLVPTPVGNLQDVTLRALDTLREATTIDAEDTRVTRKLLNHFEIQKQLIPFHAHNEHKQLERTLQTIRENEMEVTCLPGATAFVPALVASGFPCDRFVFEGFLPHKKGRQTKWKSFVDEDRTIVLYESPHRLVKALEEISTFLGPDRIVCVAREISKFFEEFKRGTAAEVLEHFKKTPPKGEIVLLIKGL